MIVSLLQNMGLSRDVPGFANKSILFARLLHMFALTGRNIPAVMACTASAYFRLRREYGSRLVNAKAFALLSAYAYFCHRKF